MARETVDFFILDIYNRIAECRSDNKNQNLRYAVKKEKDMSKLIQRIFLFERFEFKTKLSKKQIQKRVEDLTNGTYSDRCGTVNGDKFSVAKKSANYFSGGHTHNSFAPVAKCTITEGNDLTTVNGILRMKLPALLLFAPIYFLSMLTVILFPLMYLIVHLAFVKPAGKLREELENTLTEK